MERVETVDIEGRRMVSKALMTMDEALSRGLHGFPSLEDQYGNLRWELLEDGSIVEANLAPTQEQVNEYTSRSRLEKVTTVFLKIVAEAITGTATPLESWREIDQKLREKLT